MHFWVYVSKGFAFVVATTGGLGFLGYGPVKSLHPYTKLGIQLTIETPKRLAYSVPARNPPQPSAPLFSSTLLVDVSGSDVYITESLNDSTATNTFAPTKTHDSHIFLPARSRGMNITFPTALAEAAQSLVPLSLLAGHWPPPPFLHDIIGYTNVSAQLSTIFDSQLGFIGVALIIVALVFIIRRCCPKGPEAKAQSGQAQEYHLLENAWLDAMVLNDIIRKDRVDLQRRNDHLTNLVWSAFGTINSQSEDFARCMKQATEESKAKCEKLEGNICALVSVNHKLAGTVDECNARYKQFNENMTAEIADAMGIMASMETDYDNLDQQYQNSASQNQGLVQANHNLNGQNRDLDNKLRASKAKCSNLMQENTDYKARNQQLEQSSNDLQSEKDKTEQELLNVKGERDVLAQKAEDIRIKAETSEKARADSVEHVRHTQEKGGKDDVNKKLVNANKELRNLQSQIKSSKSSKSADEKKLEDKNASLERRLTQVNQEKKKLENEKAELDRGLTQAEQDRQAIQKHKEDLSNRFNTMEEELNESQEKAKADKLTIQRLGDEAQQRQEDRIIEDSQLTARLEKEQENLWAAHYHGLLEKSREGLGIVVAKKSAVEMELKTAKEDKDALARQVTELSTTSPPSCHNAPASFNTSSLPTVPALDPSKLINKYENKVIELKDALAKANYRLTRDNDKLTSRSSANGTHPYPTRMYGANGPRPGHPPHYGGPRSHQPTLVQRPGVVQAFGAGALPQNNATPMGPQGSMSSPHGGQVPGMNPDFGPHPQTSYGPLPSVGNQGQLPTPGALPPLYHQGAPSSSSGNKPPITSYEWPPKEPDSVHQDGPQGGTQGTSLNPEAAPFTPHRGS
ncbi:MAG: hypothetical protein Q9226_007431 [Calogaya cf. arnoldii]